MRNREATAAWRRAVLIGAMVLCGAGACRERAGAPADGGSGLQAPLASAQAQPIADASTLGAMGVRVVPRTVLLVRAQERALLRIHVRDAAGQPVDPARLGVTWASQDPQRVGIAEARADGSVVVRAETQRGVAEVSARGSAGQVLATARVLVLPLRPGVVRVADDEVIYFPVAPEPDGVAAADGAAARAAGAFTQDEVNEAILQALRTRAKPAREPDRTAVVLRMMAPRPGTLLVSSGEAAIMGQVLRATQRGPFALVQLQLVGEDQVFERFDDAELVLRGQGGASGSGPTVGRAHRPPATSPGVAGPAAPLRATRISPSAPRGRAPGHAASP